MSQKSRFSLTTKLNFLLEISELKFERILDQIGTGKKDLTIEPILIKPLERIFGAKWFRLHSVEKIYKLNEGSPSYENNTHVFIVSTNYKVFKNLCTHLQAQMKLNTAFEPHIIIVPKVLTVLDKLLEEMGLYGIVKLYSYCWEFIQIDSDVLTLEIPDFFYDLYINNDLSNLTSISYGLFSIFYITGKPLITISAGKYANSVVEQTNMYIEEKGLSIETNDSDFDVFIVMDRQVDFPSVLLTSITYSGLLSEIFNIKCGIVERKTDEAASTSSDTKKSTYLFNLNSASDNIYDEIKTKHISDVSGILGTYAKQLAQEKESSKEMSLSEIKNYVQTKLPETTKKAGFVKSHLDACEQIIHTLGGSFEKLHSTEQCILENINKSATLRAIEEFLMVGRKLTSLRLLCLLSLTQKLSFDDYHNFKLSYLQSVGYKYLYIFAQMVDCGIILEPPVTKLPLNISLPNIGTRKDFFTLTNKWKLIPAKPEQIDVHNPTCPSYVFGGSYIPVLAQLITFLIQTQTENELKQKLESISATYTQTGLTNPFPLTRKNILICVLGGITYSELCALKLLEKTQNCRIVVCSNNITNGNDILEDCMK